MKNFLLISATLLFATAFELCAATPASSASLHLTPEEKAFLRKNRTVTVHSETGWAPYNFTTRNKPEGYVNDTLKLLADRLGITLKYVSGKELTGYERMLQNRRIDIIANLRPTEKRQTLFLLSDKPIVDVPMAVVTKQENTRFSDLANLQQERLAVTRDFFIARGQKNDYLAQLKRSYPGIILTHKSTIPEMMEEVARGNAGAAISSYGQLNYHMKNRSDKTLVSTPLPRGSAIEPQHYHIAVRKDWPLLKSALDKAMKSITLEETVHLKEKWAILAPNEKAELLAEQKAREEAKRLAKAKTEQKAKEAQKKARLEAKRASELKAKQKAELAAKEKAERHAREEAKRLAAIEAQTIELEEKERANAEATYAANIAATPNTAHPGASDTIEVIAPFNKHEHSEGVQEGKTLLATLGAHVKVTAFIPVFSLTVNTFVLAWDAFVSTL